MCVLCPECDINNLSFRAAAGLPIKAWPASRCAQVGIPQHVAQVLTYPERVTDHNIETLRRAVANGASACSILECMGGNIAYSPHPLPCPHQVS